MNSLVLCGLLLLGMGANAAFDCGGSPGDFPKTICEDTACMNAISGQIKSELDAAFSYLYMGALFGQYTLERPGVAKFFLESATEERSHANKMLDYLSMRGVDYYKEVYSFQRNSIWKPGGLDISATAPETLTVRSALKKALQMEIGVTNQINQVITACSNDFHAADVFTNPIMEEQHTGMRKLQGAIQTLDDLMSGGDRFFAEYVFDQKMLDGEI